MTSTGNAGGRSDRSGLRTRSGRLDPDELAALEEQRDFLLGSIADLDREHSAGDLDDADHAALRDEYTARAAEVLRAIDQQRSAFASARRTRDPKRSALVVAGVALFAVVSALAVAQALGAREPGDTATGGVTVKQTSNQRAQECARMVNATSPAEPLECFRAVLDDDPNNVVALTYGAWQMSLSASYLPEADAERANAAALEQLAQAVRLQPTYSYARAFRAVVAYRSGLFEDAKRYLEEFEANDPDADSRAAIEQMDLEANIEAGLAAQQAGPLAPTSTTTVPG